jgi:hypothetical protein
MCFVIVQMGLNGTIVVQCVRFIKGEHADSDNAALNREMSMEKSLMLSSLPFPFFFAAQFYY